MCRRSCCVAIVYGYGGVQVLNGQFEDYVYTSKRGSGIGYNCTTDAIFDLTGRLVIVDSHGVQFVDIETDSHLQKVRKGRLM